MPETSILFSLKENFTERVEAMRASGNKFNKELDLMEAQAAAYDTRLTKLTETQSEYELKLKSAKTALLDAQAAQKKCNDEASATNLKNAQEAYDTLQAQLLSVKQAAKDTRGEFKNLNEDLRKMENGTYETKTISSALSSLGKAGLTNMFGSALSSIAGSYVSSAFSSDAGGYISNTLSGVTSGLSIGLATGNPALALIGALGGGVAGLIQGATEVFEHEDEAFKSYVQELYSDLASSLEENLSEGMTTAGSREQTQMAFVKKLGGKDEASD